MKCVTFDSGASLPLASGMLLFTLTFASADPPPEDPSERARQLRRVLTAERAELLDKLRQQEDIVNHLRRWIVSDPQARLRQARPHAWTSTSYSARLWQRKEVMLDRILAFPWESRGSIASGDALNALLDACGETAAQRLELQKLRPMEPQGVTPQTTQAIRDQDRLRESLQLPTEVIGRLNVTRGLTGAKLSGRINQDESVVEWPGVLQHPRFNDLRQNIERLHAQAIGELKDGKPAHVRTAFELKEVVDRLHSRVLFEASRLAKSGADANEWMMYQHAAQHIGRMKFTVLRLAEANQIGDFQVARFDGNTVEELMAFVHINAMRFAPAGPNDQEAYLQVFRAMTRYYVEMRFQNAVLEQPERELARLQSLDNLQELADRVLFIGQYSLPLWDEIRNTLPKDLPNVE